MNRRSLLAGLGSLAGAAALAGCDGPGPDRGTTTTAHSSTTTAPRTPNDVADAWGFDGVVDLAAAGADDAGERPIDDVLDRHLGSGALLYLPRGRYRVDGDVTASGVERVGVLGDGAVVVPPDGFDQTLLGLGYPDAVGDLLFEGVTFDVGADDTGGRPLFARGSGRVVVRDVTVAGEVDVDKDLLRVDVTDPDGSGLVERYVATDGAVAGTEVTGCEVGDDNRGDVAFVDCHVAGFPDNGLYARPPAGEIRVRGGTYRNNGVAGVRVQTDGSAVVRGVHVRCDDADAAGENMRGIRLRTGRDVLVEDCLVELLAVPSSDGGVTFAPELESATVRNTRIRVDAAGVNAVRIKTPAGGATRDGPFRCESVTVIGSAANGAAVRAAGRRGCAFRDVRISQTGAARDGIVAEDASGSLDDVHIAVSGRPLSLRGSTFSRRNVTVDAPP